MTVVRNGPRVGVIDGALDAVARTGMDAVFDRAPAARDDGRHGAQVARVLREHCPSARLHWAAVFDHRREAAVACVVDALYWLAGQGVQLINMSFGMQAPSRRLAAACAELAADGVLLVASAPARGAPVHPAAFAGCLAVTGDARCAPGEVSWLDTPAAEFGCHPLVHAGRPELGGGASIAAARMSGLLAALLAEGHEAGALRERLRARARYLGPERRHA